MTARFLMSARVLAAVLLLTPCAPAAARAQWSRAYDQLYYPASHNWVFRNRYAGADRLFNAFDYGHAILYETLLREHANTNKLEAHEFDYITRRLLVSPPRLPVEEMAVMPTYARLVPEAKAMFEWAHILHRQTYDVLADERLSPGERDARVAELLRYYHSRQDLAFSARPKTMALMQEQPYSLAFRRRFPKFNGLIWAYHWLQIGLYEPLLTARASTGRQTGVAAAVARFRQMVAEAPRSTPYVMPMSAAVAPEFSARYPELAIIFDNLHSMHDVVSDILANAAVPASRKRAEILLAASRYRDDTTEVMTVDGWKRMSVMMGPQNMGGAATGMLDALPTPTVSRGYVMRHDRDGNMVGDHAGHDTTGQGARARDPHAGHGAAKDSAAAKRDTTAQPAAPGLVQRQRPADGKRRVEGIAHRAVLGHRQLDRALGVRALDAIAR